MGVSEAKRQSPGAAMRARERDGLFDIVRWELRNPAVGIACPGRDAARAQRSGASLIRDRQRLRRSIEIPATEPPKTRDTRKTRTAIGRTATGNAVSEHR